MGSIANFVTTQISIDTRIVIVYIVAANYGLVVWLRGKSPRLHH